MSSKVGICLSTACGTNMAAFLTAVCVVASVTSLQAEIGTLTTMLSSDTDVTNRKVNNKTFVDVIKENLRRNNDDYANNAQLDGELQSPIKTRRLMNESEQIVKSEEAQETDITPATPAVVHLVSKVFRSAKDFVRKKKHDHHSKHTGHEITSTTKSTHSEMDRKVSTDKRKLHMGKNNKPSSKIEASQPARASRSHNAVRTPSNVARQVTTNPETTKPTYPKPRHPNQFAVLPLRSVGPVRQPPSADQLDMAPARGAYIHDMRLKGKFCYRHVLWPEGPKYNSKGETIMPAFNASIYHGKRKFFETHKPLFVLPRCCNCCKKSVLGCQ